MSNEEATKHVEEVAGNPKPEEQVVPVSSCCSVSEQSSCCEESAKASCCGSTTGSCGCK